MLKYNIKRSKEKTMNVSIENGKKYVRNTVNISKKCSRKFCITDFHMGNSSFKTVFV